MLREQAVVGRNAGQRSPVGWQAGDHRRGVCEPSLGEADNSLLASFGMAIEMTASVGPTCLVGSDRGVREQAGGTGARLGDI